MSAWTTCPLVVGHRGGRGRARPDRSESHAHADPWPPENTMPAFDRARAEGAKAVELDVRTCRGGEAVVFHDPTLTRMTGGRDSRLVEDVTLAELRTIDLGGGARIPSLADVLAWARHYGVAINVEVKHDVPSRIDVVVATARAVRNARADVLLSSFDPIALAMAALRMPFVPRALLTHARQPCWANLVAWASRPPYVLAVHAERTQLTSRGVTALVRRGLRVGVWTVNDPGEARGWLRDGVASIITDVPGELIAHVTAPLSSCRS